jgi:hypothetical protein
VDPLVDWGADFQFTVDQPPKTATIGATKASLLDEMTNLCNSVQSLIERFQPAHGHVAHRQLLVMRNMLCMGNVGQYAALPAIAFGGYFSPFFCNKNQGIYAVDFLEFARCHGS